MINFEMDYFLKSVAARKLSSEGTVVLSHPESLITMTKGSSPSGAPH